MAERKRIGGDSMNTDDNANILSSHQRAAIIQYLGGEVELERLGVAEEERDAYLRFVSETVGFKAWELTGTHDNPVARLIHAYQDVMVRSWFDDNDTAE